MRVHLLLLFIFNFIYSTTDININQIEDSKVYKEHISLSLDETMINDFLKQILPIKDKGEKLLITYRWSLINPRIDIEEDTVLFLSEIEIKVGELKTVKDIEGYLSVNFDQETDKILLKIEEAKVILDINLFGKDIVLGELDIGKYFSEPFKLNGPSPISNNINYKLPNGDIRKIKVKTHKSELKLVKDAIQVVTSLHFSKIE